MTNSSKTTGTRRIVFLLNRRPEPVQTTLTVAAEQRPPTELITGESVKCRPAGDNLRLTARLGPHGVRCYLFG